MLRGIRKASANWLGKRRHGRRARPDRHQLRASGASATSSAASAASTVAKIGGTEIRVEQFRQLYKDRLQQLGRQLGRPILPDQARALGLDRQVLGEMIAETVLDERARAAAARHVAMPRSRAQITEDPDLPRHHRPVRPHPLRADASATGRLHRGALRGRAARDRAAPAARSARVGGEPPVPKTAIEAFNRYQNEQRTIEYVVLGRGAGRRDRRPDAGGAREIFRGAQGRVPRAGIPQGRDRACCTPEELAPWIEVSDADLQEGLRGPPGALRDAGAAPPPADRVPERWTRRRPQPTSSPRARRSRRSPPSAG